MIRWYKKKTIIVILTIIVLYSLFRCKKYTVRYNAIVSNSRPIEVWEFVSDFNNMKKLNPTIKDFNILSESGNYKHWKYQVFYTECLSQLPSVTNFAWADFEAKKISDNEFVIHSTHKTCFMTSYTCVHTESTFLVEPTIDRYETSYTEIIDYECPVLFSKFCYTEVLHQREKIRKNLDYIFTTYRHRNT
ncbi:uncharacterized protein LOC135840147 [Planococcus citri]|uniref:uncharacterized protein LOC135840147 n=1 Tax=Planococcus citri TaxID=170843 RepID=UPI0031F81B79